MPRQALYMGSKKFFLGFTLKVTYSCKMLPCLTKIFACSQFPEESHHFMFVKQQRAFLKLLVYKSAPEKIQLYPAKCQGTVPSKRLSLMLARIVLFWTHMYISPFLDWDPFGMPKMRSITTSQFLLSLIFFLSPQSYKSKGYWQHYFIITQSTNLQCQRTLDPNLCFHPELHTHNGINRLGPVQGISKPIRPFSAQ